MSEKQKPEVESLHDTIQRVHSRLVTDDTGHKPDKNELTELLEEVQNTPWIQRHLSFSLSADEKEHLEKTWRQLEAVLLIVLVALFIGLASTVISSGLLVDSLSPDEVEQFSQSLSWYIITCLLLLPTSVALYAVMALRDYGRSGLEKLTLSQKKLKYISEKFLSAKEQLAAQHLSDDVQGSFVQTDLEMGNGKALLDEE
jgi:hypothetical protein